ncbi:MAG: NADPH:quinone oxidoreductase family protein [Gammaproteobacteria bacterium]|nr:NADPH:quinone oxidoreductase family protein [Gammaproteobacteria bacterium]
MKAIVCRELGPPEKLVLDEVADPGCGTGEAVIRVRAAGVNFPDTLLIEGRYQMRLQPPFTPGAEVAGEVLKTGPGVKSLAVGQRVAAVLPSGGYAEQVCAPAQTMLPLPDSLDFVHAAAFPLVYGTALHALDQRGQLQPGETLLVLGAAGGTGLAAVQLGKLLGARVIAAASNEAKLGFCRNHGADETINYERDSLKQRVKALTGGRGADVIFDPVGDRWAADCLSSLAWNGRWLITGFAGGTIPQIPANKLLLKGAAAAGVFWGSFVAREPQKNLDNFKRLFAWQAAGRLQPPVTRTYPLAQAGQALRDLLERRATGKLVLLP